MTFWSNANSDPTRRYNFRISHTSIDSGDWFWANTVTKPIITVSSNNYQVINHTFKVPGVATWEDVTVQIVDVGKKTKKLYDALVASGYNIPTKSAKGIEKKSSDQLIIYQMDSAGKTIEKWTLHNAFMKSINFGELSYSDDELVTLDIIFGYDFAEFAEQ
jgi:hypothetical protein